MKSQKTNQQKQFILISFNYSNSNSHSSIYPLGMESPQKVPFNPQDTFACSQYLLNSRFYGPSSPVKNLFLEQNRNLPKPRKLFSTLFWLSKNSSYLLFYLCSLVKCVYELSFYVLSLLISSLLLLKRCEIIFLL